jgi:5-(carboxyamino)imidazole ribonucleotide synthase
MKIGIIGAGQLGRMLALAGYPLGLQFHFLDRSADTPGGQVAPIVVGEFEDRARLQELDAAVDVVTFDWENIPVAALETIATGKVLPPAPALATSQDRLLEKQLFEELRIPTPAFAAVDTQADLLRATQRIGMPGVLKTRRFGYDGKGQAVIRSTADAERAWTQLGTQPLLYEEFVNFTAEVSVIGARSTRGEVAIYPLSANTHSGGILRHTIAPFSRPPLTRLAQRYLRAILRRFGYAGILAIEFFVVGGRLLANEMAPRVHNSGHWTIEGAHTSQFENHLRAILGWPLGSTAPRGHAAMINFIGALPDRERWIREPGLHFHDYGKSARPNRKVGHCTLVEPSAARRDLRLRRLLNRLGSQPGTP